MRKSELLKVFEVHFHFFLFIFTLGLLQIICSSIFIFILFYYFILFGFREEEAQEESWRVFDLWFGLLQHSTCGMSKDVGVVNLISTSCNLSMKEGSLFVLFVLMRSTELGCFRLCSWCLAKALDKEGCMGLVPWCLELRCKSSGILNDFFTKN